ncbi:MAG: CDP-alcohol phosphatidyltransferase family protein [Candidatus Thalassarchaeaceae archaeon]|nr:CDP-alcohol phosphatidyltransferase family protein [Candidatus Thalassarchaeaceae archaeon]
MAEGKYGDSSAKDLSDWGRPIARFFAKKIEPTRITVIQVTNFHLLLSIICAWLIIENNIILACFLLVIKGVIDAIDGELARIRKKPSHVGRYWDTVADTIGLILVMIAFGEALDWDISLSIGIILAILFQYSLFNHFSVRMRLLGSGDTTSRIDERMRPIAHPWEKQRNVNIFHLIYLLFFSWQDRIISTLTGKGSEKLVWELTLSSLLGYGVQSLLILILSISNNMQYLPNLVLELNIFIMLIIIIKSRL